ncbi:MAG TPA: hypothetical protein VE986_04570 [Hyphomicrobiales bacterium]|nr:hypothetical protein [Hyphomicrobiales bacterium]
MLGKLFAFFANGTMAGRGFWAVLTNPHFRLTVIFGAVFVGGFVWGFSHEHAAKIDALNRADDRYAQILKDALAKAKADADKQVAQAIAGDRAQHVCQPAAVQAQKTAAPARKKR